MDPLQGALDRHSRDLIPTFVRIFIFIYSVIAGSHLLLLPDVMVVPMTSLAAGSVFFAVVVQLQLDNQRVLEHSELVLLSLLVLMGVNTIAHLYFSGDIKQTTNFIFVMAVSGYVLPGYRTFYPTLLLLIGAWVLLVFVKFDWTSETIHFGFEILLGAMFAIFLQTVRRNQLEQLSDLEKSIERLNESRKQVIAGESLMQSLLDNIPAGILVRDINTKVQYVNLAARQLLGTGERELLGLTVDDDFLDLRDIEGRALAADRKPVRRVLDSKETVENEILGVQHPTGEMVWTLVNAFPLNILTTNQPVVVIAFVNITDQVNADIQLHRSEARAHTILNSVADGVIVTDEDELVTLFNPGAQRLTGLTEEQTLGQPLKTVFKFKEEGIVHGVTADGGDVQQGSVLSAQGAAVAIELLVSEILDAEERSGRVYTFRDVGEQLRYEQEQATLDKMTSVGVLAGGIAHDFNNLLTAVYGNVSLAESVIDQPEKALVFLKRSSESIQMAANLTKQLLTFATGSEPVRNVTNAEQLVREAVGFALSGSSVAVTFDVESDVDDIEVDSGQVQQAIGNIVLNAKQALRDEGLIEIVVRNSARRVESSDSFVEVVIKDNGPGMDSVILSRIFDPYFTTKEHGTGLGLATTHSILVKHEGAITVDSSQGEGARFAILLPSAKKIVDTREVQEPGNLVPAGALEVLVMDDEDIVLQTIVDLLTYLGHNTTASHHGEEAVSTYIDRLKQGRRFDLVVMDLTVIGGMGGKAAAALILEHDPEARIVVSSGYSADAEMSRFKELGFVARLEKPFDSGALEAMISEVIR